MNLTDAASAVALIKDGDTVLVDGSGGGVNEPGALLAALEKKYLDERHPRDLTLIHVSGMGDAHGGGIDRFAHAGMVRRVIGGHWGWTPGMQALALAGDIEAYCLPQGTLSHLLREIAGGRPGVISTVGIGTFVDPRLGGGRLNQEAVDDVVRLIDIDGQEYLFTKAFPIDVAIVRGSIADEHGNISMDREGLFAETLSAAQAARNSGGLVLAQVKEITDEPNLDPRRVRIPGVLVDALVVDPCQRLSFDTDSDPYKTGEARSDHSDFEPVEHSVRKLIARRAALELHTGDIVNLGYGMPDGVGSVLAEEGALADVTFTVEQGHIGGVPVGGNDFGLCLNPQASVDAGYQFDWYDGGGLDLAVLSFAELDADGNVNVGRFGGRMPGVGGFINISQGAQRLVFVGTFVAGAKYPKPADGHVVLPQGGSSKLVPAVEQISFSGRIARDRGQDVTYVTERAVFKLTVRGLTLTELAPGIDLHRDVLDLIPFEPLIAAELLPMDPRIFHVHPMGIELQRRESGAPS